MSNKILKTFAVFVIFSTLLSTFIYSEESKTYYPAALAYQLDYSPNKGDGIESPSFSKPKSLQNIKLSQFKPISYEESPKSESKASSATFGTLSTATASGQNYAEYNHLLSSAGSFVSGSYQTNLFTGSAGYSYQIGVPPGVNGLNPFVSLNYNHMAAGPIAGVLGSGWNLNENFIYRDTNYTRSNTSDDYFRISFNGINEKLIYVSSEDRYHTKHESYLYIKREIGANNDKGDYWIVKTKDGTTFRFGYNYDSELVSNLEDYTSIWGLDQIEDTHNNKISYNYLENPNSDIGAGYIKDISYNNGLNRIEFVYNYNLISPITVYSSGNEIRQSGILKEIIVKHNNSLVRKYTLEYSDLGHKTSTFLTSITQIGSDGISALPSITFEYFTPASGWEINNSWSIPDGSHFVKDGWKDNGVRLVDINFDGLTDILRMYNSSDIEFWKNNGSGWDKKETWGAFFSGGFVGSDGLDKGVRFIDLNSDARLDFIKAEAGDRLTKTNQGGNTEWQWNTSQIDFPDGADFIKTTGKVVEWIDCWPGNCSSGYAAISYVCSGSKCTLICSNKRCSGVTPQLVWQDDYYEAGYYGWCDSVTDDFNYCGSQSTLSGMDCNAPQPYCFFMQHLGGGANADSTVNSQDYELDYVGDKKTGCTTNVFDGSWEWRYQRDTYCIPSYLSCGGDSNCRNDCWNEQAMAWASFELDPSQNTDCSDTVFFQAYQECGAAINVYTVPVIGEEITTECNREGIYELPIDQGVRAIDVNGDGHSDIVKGTNTERKTWLGNGLNWTLSFDWQMPIDAYFVDGDGKDQGVRIADINSDGLPDLLKGDGSVRKSWINTGKGWQLKDSWIIPIETMFIQGETDLGVRIEDVNGDGLNDLVKNNGSIVKTWLNNGTNWMPDPAWNIPSEANFTDSVVRLADVNGDNLVDLIKGSSSDKKTWLNKLSKQFLLKKVTNSFGGVVELDYKKMSYLDNTGEDEINDFGFNGWVISSIKRNNKIDGPQHVVSTISYNYSNGLFDSKEKEFRGFSYVLEILPDGTKIEHFYHQDDARSSLEYQTNIFDVYNNPFQKVEYLWESELRDGYHIVQLKEVADYTYDGWSWD